eukprot:c13871_g1_i1 orf=1-738(-)
MAMGLSSPTPQLWWADFFGSEGTTVGRHRPGSCNCRIILRRGGASSPEKSGCCKRSWIVLNNRRSGRVKLKEKLGRDGLKECVDEVERQGVDADVRSYATLLRCCGKAKALSEGKRVHACIVESGLGGDRYLGNLLVEMYGECGKMEESRAVFDKIRQRDVFSWTIVIAAYAHNGYAREALQLFWQMRQGGVKPNMVTFVEILGACACQAVLAEGKLIHAIMVVDGFLSDDVGNFLVLGNALINMY